MSVTVDESAITAANKRVATAVGRYAAAHRRKRGVSDPSIVDGYQGELAMANLARDITTGLAKRPNLTVPQRLELIDLLMPSVFVWCVDRWLLRFRLPAMSSATATGNTIGGGGTPRPWT